MSSSRELLSAVETVMRLEIQRLFSEIRAQAAGDDEWSARTLEWLEEYCLRPGKGIRPALVAAGAAAARSQSIQEAIQDEGVRRAMLLTALLHKRLLMADDVADRDELRNDEPAFHVMLETWLESHPNYASLSRESRAHYARSYTEVSGIWLQEMVTTELVALQRFLPADRWQQLAKDFDRHSYQRTLAGWFTLLDQNLEVLDENVSRERFLRGLEMITSDYTFVSPLLVGSAFGAENQTLRQVAIEYGHQVGIIFQLSDDVLGLYGDPAVTGKPVGGDVREGKKTLLVQEAYALANAEEKMQLQYLVGKPDLSEAETEWVRTFVKESGAWEAVQKTISEYVTRAQQALAPWPDQPTFQLLNELITVIATRKK